MRIHAPLADQPQPGQAVQQRCLDLRAFPDQHECFSVLQPLREHSIVLDVIVPDRDVMPGELAETTQCANGIEIIIEDRDFHGWISLHQPTSKP
jgi:hypothetical protein